MEDMPLSGPDNTKLEVSECILCKSSFNCHPDADVMGFISSDIQFVFVFEWSYYLSCCRPWSMTSTLSWWKTPVWACVLRYIVLWNRAISFWMKRTKRAWRSSVGAMTSSLFWSTGRLIRLWCVCLQYFLCDSSRNRGSARGGHIWPSVQSVEKQRVRVPKLQKIDSSFSLRPTLGEMPWHGAQQQSHRQPQVRQ